MRMRSSIPRRLLYQRIVVTRWRDDLRLFIDGALQFSSTDEYRYHASLVHPALSLFGIRSRSWFSAAETASPYASCSNTKKSTKSRS